MTRYVVEDRRYSIRDIVGKLFEGNIPPSRIYVTRDAAQRDAYPTETIFAVSVYGTIRDKSEAGTVEEGRE